ncbi:C39 family peptidase [Mycoplasma sp. P36-A1]|uniref:C39 family peptidase n=1 Tax=Mycoplasma sp. P36-A1 TaxID=3252900 RepID=UPI003C2DBFFC
MKYFKRGVLILLTIFLVLNLLLAIGLKVSNSNITLFDIYKQKLPLKDNIEVKYSNTFLSEKISSFPMQEYNECSGYATAYNLRTRNIKVNSKKVYEEMKYKLGNGYVLPESISNYLEEKGFKITLNQGSFKQLKTRLNKGFPIIVLIGEGLKWQHYVNVVGYDENNVYLYDSLVKNQTNKYYNRKLNNKVFLKYWDNKLPMFNNIYYTIEDH